MKRSVLFSALLLMICPALVRADLPSDIRAVLSDKLFSRGEVGVEIIRLGSSAAGSQMIYEFHGTAPRIPASNLKVVTTATAVDRLGADFQFKTTLARRGADLAIIGDGDPTFGDVEMLRKLGWGVDTVFKAWADMLKKRGIDQIHDLYVDDSIFDQEFLHPNWPTDQAHKRYEAQVGGINLNANCVDFYLTTAGYNSAVNFRTEPATRYINVRNTCVTGNKNAIWLSRQMGTNDVVLRGETNVSNDEPVSVTIHDPPMFAGTVLAETLQANGIRMTGTVQRDRTIRTALAGQAPATQPVDAWVPLAVHATPLALVLSRANKDSMNLYAESLCKRIGAAATGQSGSWENGTAAVGAFLRSLGVSEDEFSLDDGCGLSKKNVISPNAMARVLEHEFFDKNRDVYLSSLAIAGVDGTLKDRFGGSDLRNRVFGKSGYVLGVRSLSGFLKARDGQWYAFSILMNGLVESDWGAKQLQERIVQAVDAASGGGRVASGE